MLIINYIYFKIIFLEIFNFFIKSIFIKNKKIFCKKIKNKKCIYKFIYNKKDKKIIKSKKISFI